MKGLNVRKLIGAFIYVVAISLLLLSIISVLNKVDYVHEYNECMEIAQQDYITNPGMIKECKDNASEGLGFKIRQNQQKLSVLQHIQIYLAGIVNVLTAIILMIVGKVIYAIEPIQAQVETSNKTNNTKKKTTKKRRTAKKKTPKKKSKVKTKKRKK